ncbi:MAG TPA: DUF5050 domain-containing protein [Clostridiaceae bacterium]|nr:DUF5050 domain-containing protein [Clostridiaceae bacterium]
MAMKLRFKWKEGKERSVYEIVSEDGVQRANDILYIIRQLCHLLDNRKGRVEAGPRGFIHPKSIIVKTDGSVRLSDRDPSPSAVGPYLPPEFERNDPVTPRTNVYALGMLMLFMATGKEKKTDAEAVIGDRSLLSLIERCTAFDPKERIQNTSKLLDAVRYAGRPGKKSLPLLLLLIFISLLITISIAFWKKGTMRGSSIGDIKGFDSGYAGGYKQGFSDAPGIGLGAASFDTANGNLPGNLSSGVGAIAVRSEDFVFFLLGDTIYSMNPYTKELQIILENSGANDLHYYNGQLYYTTNESVLSIDPKTKKGDVLCDSHTGKLYIIDDTFYLYDNVTLYLYAIDPRHKSLTQLNGAMEFLSLQIVGEKLFYIAPDRGNSIYACDLDGGNDTLISSNFYESFCIYGDKLYAGTEEGLTRMDLNGGNQERLTTLPAYYPNVSDGGILYISGSDRTLEWLAFDGKMRYTVVPASTASFNVAGQWIFYQNMKDSDVLWRVRVSGSDNARLTE